jgi:threonine/homoserine/homoserine lactone efflux protein
MLISDLMMIHDILPSNALFAAFLIASLVLAIVPGPAVLYIVTRTLTQGRPSGLVSVAGVALGNLGNAIGASLGLAALFAIWSSAFTIVKFAGALYLIYLGIQVLRTAPATFVRPTHSAKSLTRIFREGFVVALLNPKTAIFFAAFLPQFLGTPEVTGLRTVALGAIFVVVAASTDLLYVLTAGLIAPKLERAVRTRSVGRYVSASAFFGLGLYAAFAGSHNAKS